MIDRESLNVLVRSINALTDTIAREGAKNREAQESILARRMEEDRALQQRWFEFHQELDAKQAKDADVRNEHKISLGAIVSAVRYFESQGETTTADLLIGYGRRLSEDSRMVKTVLGFEPASPVDSKTAEKEKP